MTEQAGDPFEGENVVDKPDSEAGRMAAIETIQENHRPPTEEMEDAQKVLAEFEELKEAEASEEDAAASLTVEDARALVKTTAQAVTDAVFNLDKARKAYQIAGQLEVECSAKPSLAEMNRSQRKVTATEVRRKARAMKALGELGFGNQKLKPYPTLFKST